MKMQIHYMHFREFFSNVSESQVILVTLDELSAILDCTHRNVVLILKRMTQLQWLTWQPKRGRGNKSALTFIVRMEDMALEIARNLVEKRDLRGALEQMNHPSVPPMSRDTFQIWLYGYFGHIGK